MKNKSTRSAGPQLVPQLNYLFRPHTLRCINQPDKPLTPIALGSLVLLWTTCLALLALLSAVPASAAKSTPRGTGLVFGEKFSYLATAPKNWVLDNQSAARHGIHMLFYPKQYNFKSSPVVVYGRSALITGKRKDAVKEQVARVIAHLKKTGNPKITAKYFNTLKLQNKQEIMLYRFSGHASGHHEIAAYILEPDSVNFLVFNANSQTAYNQFYDDFIKILQSYKNAFDNQAGMTRKEFD